MTLVLFIRQFHLHTTVSLRRCRKQNAKGRHALVSGWVSHQVLTKHFESTLEYKNTRAVHPWKADSGAHRERLKHCGFNLAAACRVDKSMDCSFSSVQGKMQGKMHGKIQGKMHRS